MTEAEVILRLAVYYIKNDLTREHVDYLSMVLI